MAKSNTPTLLICASIGLLLGFVSCTSGGGPPRANAPVTSQAIADETGEHIVSAPSTTRKGDAEGIYLEQVNSKCSVQTKSTFDARVFDFWNQAREAMEKDGNPAEYHLYLKLDELYEKGRSETRGKTFGGDAKSQITIRPLTQDIAAVLNALAYADQSETPAAPQVNMKDCLGSVDALLNEVL